MKAVIISCDEGTRLRPVTCSMPKSMIPLMGRPIIEYMFRLLRRHNINDITIAADYLSEEIKKHFSYLRPGEDCPDFVSVQPLENFCKDDDVLLISDSIVTDINFEELLHCFYTNNSCTIVSTPESSSYEYGSIHTDSRSVVTSYTRSPDFIHPSGMAVTGIMVIPKGTGVCDCCDLSAFIENLTAAGEKVFAYSPQCYIKNISDFESYKKCIRDFMDKKISLPFPCDEKAPSVWVDEDATVMQGSVIVPPVYIGRRSIVSKGARVEAYTQLGSDVSIDCLAGIKRSTVMSGSHIGEGCCVRGAIIGQNCELGFESAAYEGSVIASGTSLGKHCTVKTGVHIWPDKTIEDESAISENIIWENSSARSLFYNGSASGIINRDITPEFSATLARSTVSLLGKKIAVSCDVSGAGSMIKNALVAGIQSAGGKAYDLGEEPLPITRSAVRFYGLDGGIALSCQHKEGNFQGSLDIINALGADIENHDLKKLEQLVSSREAGRVAAHKISDIEYLFEYKLYYLKQLINSTSQKSLGAKLLIHCPSAWAMELLKSAAHDLKCDFTFTQTSDPEIFSRQLQDGAYDFGAICDYKCESLTLVTNSGRVLNEFDYCALSSLVIMKSFPNASIYIPMSSPESIELMAEKYGAVIYRTQTSPPYLMNELSKNKRKLFLQQFIYHFDAVGAIILLTDFLHQKNTSIEELLSEIPAFHMISTSISCSSKDQTKILHKLSELHNSQSGDEADAIRFTFENGWVLVIPKRTQSVINVISHGYTKEYAREIADIFTDTISRG